jgi:hypothetical protein
MFLYCNHQVHRDFLITLYIELIEKQAAQSSRLMNDVANPDDGNKVSP